MIAALYVQLRSIYYQFQDIDIDCWDELRDARQYCGPDPVIAHPPCNLWSKARSGFHPPEIWGKDQGCFEHALNCTLRFGGVLEHPAYTHAWKHFKLQRPEVYGWTQAMAGYWVGQVDQGAYGHKARKTTWLLYHGRNSPPALKLCNPETVFPELSNVCKRGQKSATPPEFARLLIQLARNANVSNPMWATGEPIENPG